MNPITNLHQGQNKVIVSMGYDSITTSVTLIPGHGTILPDVSTSYNLVWWNASDYLNPTDDPSVEIVKCIAKFGDILIVMRSQQHTLASPKNIPGKLYNMALLSDTLHDSNLDTNLNTLSYYNIPQIHGKTKHDATTIDGGTALPIGQLPTHGIGAHTGTIGTWANIDKTTSSITDITTKSHGSLTDGVISGTTNNHATIDTHIAATGTLVHGLGTLATQNGTFSGTSSGTNTGDQTDISGSSASCTGNAATATTIAPAGTAGQFLISNGGSPPTFQTPARQISFTAGTDIFQAHDAMAFTTNNTYVKLKTITLGYLPNATLRITFMLNGWGTAAYARIYRNGVAVGTERIQLTGSNWVEYVENIAGWAQGNTLELWGRSGTIYSIGVQAFRILVTNASLTNS